MIKLLTAAALAATTLGMALAQDSAKTVPAASKTTAIPIQFAGDTIHAIEVSDLKASVSWYQRVLGSELVLDLSEMGWCEVSTPTAGNVIGLSQKQPGADSKGPGATQLSFGVKNIERSAEWLRSQGVEIGEIADIPDTVRLLEFTDLDGNRLMFHEPAEVGS